MAREGGGQVSYRIDFGPEWERAVAALAAADKEFPKKLDKTTRMIANVAVLKAKAKAMQIPAKGRYTRDTRETIARGVRSRKSNRTGGRRITTAMPLGEEMLPRGFQSQWTHPVFGKGMTVQAPHFDWFIGPIGSEYDETLRAYNHDINEIIRQVDRMV